MAIDAAQLALAMQRSLDDAPVRRTPKATSFKIADCSSITPLYQPVHNNCFADALCNATGWDPAEVRQLLGLRDAEMFDVGCPAATTRLEELLAAGDIRLCLYVPAPGTGCTRTGNTVTALTPFMVFNEGGRRGVSLLLDGSVTDAGVSGHFSRLV